MRYADFDELINTINGHVRAADVNNNNFISNFLRAEKRVFDGCGGVARDDADGQKR